MKNQRFYYWILPANEFTHKVLASRLPYENFDEGSLLWETPKAIVDFLDKSKAAENYEYKLFRSNGRDGELIEVINPKKQKVASIVRKIKRGSQFKKPS
jgi:hypothetical protein